MRLDNAYYIYPSEYEYRSSEKCSRDEEMSPFEIDKLHKFQLATIEDYRHESINSHRWNIFFNDRYERLYARKRIV